MQQSIYAAAAHKEVLRGDTDGSSGQTPSIPTWHGISGGTTHGRPDRVGLRPGAAAAAHRARERLSTEGAQAMTRDLERGQRAWDVLTTIRWQLTLWYVLLLALALLL